MLSAKHARNLRGGLFEQQTMNKTYRNNMTNMKLIRPSPDYSRFFLKKGAN